MDASFRFEPSCDLTLPRTPLHHASIRANAPFFRRPPVVDVVEASGSGACDRVDDEVDRINAFERSGEGVAPGSIDEAEDRRVSRAEYDARSTDDSRDRPLPLSSDPCIRRVSIEAGLGADDASVDS